MSEATRFAALFAAQFAALGVALPFLPAVFAARGLNASEVAIVLAGASAMRLVAGPTIARLADRSGAPGRVLALAAVAAAVCSLGFLVAPGFLVVLLVALAYGAAIAPVIPLSDALALGASRRGAFVYAPVRSWGSIAFLLAAALAGQLADAAGVGATVWLIALGLAATAVVALALPAAPAVARGGGDWRAPFRNAGFRALLPVSALIQGSHALYYAFATIHWQAAGLSSGLIGLLFAESVLAEVALFAFGGRLAERLGARRLALLAAGCGVLRWAVTAETTAWPVLAVVQALHAATFGAMHLAAMRVLIGLPAAQAATAQALHGAVGVGAPMLVLTLASGALFAAFGGAAFWAMAALSALGLVAAWRLPAPR